MYDIIGDVHGHYNTLYRLLEKLGYEYDVNNHRFTSPVGRTAIFVGDYVDRGYQNVQTVQLIRNMVTHGDAHAIMGNHDFNNVMWTMPDPKAPGKYLRRHTESNRKQQETYLAEVEGDAYLHREMTDFFKSCPVFLEVGNAKIVHACWYPSAIKRLTSVGHLDVTGRITDDGWLAAGDKSTQSHNDFDALLKGPKEQIPSRGAYRDAQGELRDRARIAWWQANPKTNGEAYTSMPRSKFLEEAFHAVSRGPQAAEIAQNMDDLAPNQVVFFGHISKQGRPKPLANNIICVDWGIGKRGLLTAFRIDNIKNPGHGRFITVPCETTRRPHPQPPK